MTRDLTHLKNLSRVSYMVLAMALGGGMLTACDHAENTLKADRGLHMEFQDYRDGLATRLPLAGDEDAADDTGIPELQAYYAEPSENLKPMPLVSISVNQTVPIKDALFELARQADYDIELDPRITGSIIFTAREKPFDVVIKRISEMTGLRYKFEDDTVRIEMDTPYSKTYKIDYLNYVRSTTSSVQNNVSVVTGEGADTGSDFNAGSTSEADFWGELSSNLTQILGVRESSGNLRTNVDPQITAVENNPQAVQPVVTEGENGEQVVQTQPPQATLQVNSLPPVGAGGAGGAEEDDAVTSGFSVNRQAGMISVYGTERQQKEVAEYLQQVKRSVTSQVLIEAKILEVSLTDEFSTGIDWSRISLTGQATLDFASPQRVFLDATTPAGAGTTLTVGGNDINAVISALSRFGTVRALSSPRLTVLNNQSAALNVAENLVYFELDVETNTSDAGIVTTVESEVRNVPEGVLINVQPSINLDEHSVSMSIRPTVTNVDRFETDPAVAIAAAAAGAPGVASQIPVVQVQEFDSVIKMNSGQAVIMGGLMQDRAQVSENGIPVLSEVPLIGNVFKSHVDSIQKTELIVFLKATIMDGGDNIHNTDRETYKLFSDDRRPLNL